jgi:hypothetical protein
MEEDEELVDFSLDSLEAQREAFFILLSQDELVSLGNLKEDEGSMNLEVPSKLGLKKPSPQGARTSSISDPRFSSSQ